MSSMIKGKELMVLIDPTDVGGSFNGYMTIAYATSHTLDVGTSFESVATKDDNELYQYQEPNGQNWSVKTENLVPVDTSDDSSNLYADLLSIMRSGQKVMLWFGYVKGSAGVERKGRNWNDSSLQGGTASEYNEVTFEDGGTGEAIITSIEMNAENKGNVSYTATFTGVGKIDF